MTQTTQEQHLATASSTMDPGRTNLVGVWPTKMTRSPSSGRQPDRHTLFKAFSVWLRSARHGIAKHSSHFFL
jgi:hypothetical protein